MLIGVLSGVTGGVKSDNSFEFALRFPVNITSLLISLLTSFEFLLGTSSSRALFFKLQTNQFQL